MWPTDVVIDAMTDDLGQVALRDLVPFDPVAVATGPGAATSAAEGSPSRERLVRIAAMIRDAERAMPAPTRRSRRHGARLIPLAPRRHRLRRPTPTVVVELAS